jgi:hypothetical protein
MKFITFAALIVALVAVANCASYVIVKPAGARVARSPQFFPGGGFGGSAASANAASQSFGGGFGGFGGSAASANAASQSFGGGFPGGFSGSSANAGAQSFGFGK